MRLSISIIPAAALAAFTLAPSAMASAPALAGQSQATVSAPTPFPVHDSGQVLTTTHPVTPNERLVIAGRPETLSWVFHPGTGQLYVAQVKGVLPASWKDRTLAAVTEG